jgi:hypothetical protein
LRRLLGVALLRRPIPVLVTAVALARHKMGTI